MAKGRTRTILFVGLAGVAAGVAIGLLLAPESGTKTRKKLKKRLREVADNFQDEFSDQLDNLKKTLHLDEEEKPKSSTTKKAPKPKA